jgi:hypothetical protein
MLILMAPPFFYNGVRLAKSQLRREGPHRRWRNYIQQGWRLASRRERVVEAALIAWSFGFMVMMPVAGLSLMSTWPLNWITIPAVLVGGAMVQLGLGAALAVSMRRR